MKPTTFCGTEDKITNCDCVKLCVGGIKMLSGKMWSNDNFQNDRIGSESICYLVE
jgi:hypothetical protein